MEEEREEEEEEAEEASGQQPSASQQPAAISFHLAQGRLGVPAFALSEGEGRPCQRHGAADACHGSLLPQSWQCLRAATPQ